MPSAISCRWGACGPVKSAAPSVRAKSSDAARVREHITTAIFALGMVARTFNRPGLAFATTVDFHDYLATTLHELEAAHARAAATGRSRGVIVPRTRAARRRSSTSGTSRR